MKKLFIAALVTTTCSVAYAADLPGTAYIGGSIGYGMVMQDMERDYYADQSDNASAYNLSLFGGWRWQNKDKYFVGVEGKMRFSAYATSFDYLGYHYGEDTEVPFKVEKLGVSDFDFKQLSLGLSTHAGKWIKPNLSLYGILGLNHNTVSLENNSDDQSYQSLEVGVGSDWRFKDNWSLRTQMTYDHGINSLYEGGKEKWMQNGINLDIGIKYSF